MAGQKKEGERRGRKVDDAADEWVQTRSEREKERASDAVASGDEGRAGRGRAGCAGGLAKRAARGSRRVGRARQGRPGKGEGEEGRASWARRCLSPFFSNQMFIKFYFLHFHF